MRTKNKKGFTLLELIIVIVILGVLTTLISGFFLNSLKRGRDTRRKGDLKGIQTAVESYYADKNSYPTTSELLAGNPICETNPSQDCGDEKMYLKKMPEDPIAKYKYQYISDGIYYVLYATLENEDDRGKGVRQDGYPGYQGASIDCGGSGECEYGISSPNVYMEDDIAIDQSGGSNPGTGGTGVPTSAPTGSAQCGANGQPCCNVGSSGSMPPTFFGDCNDELTCNTSTLRCESSSPGPTCPDGYYCSMTISCAEGYQPSNIDVPGACSQFQTCYTCVPNDAGGGVCADVITYAVDSGGTCQAFPTSCLPEGWTEVSSCPTPTPTPWFGYGY